MRDSGDYTEPPSLNLDEPDSEEYEQIGVPTTVSAVVDTIAKQNNSIDTSSCSDNTTKEQDSSEDPATSDDNSSKDEPSHNPVDSPTASSDKQSTEGGSSTAGTDYLNKQGDLDTIFTARIREKITTSSYVHVSPSPDPEHSIQQDASWHIKGTASILLTDQPLKHPEEDDGLTVDLDKSTDKLTSSHINYCSSSKSGPPIVNCDNNDGNKHSTTGKSDDGSSSQTGSNSSSQNTASSSSTGNSESANGCGGSGGRDDDDKGNKDNQISAEESSAEEESSDDEEDVQKKVLYFTNNLSL